MYKANLRSKFTKQIYEANLPFPRGDFMEAAQTKDWRTLSEAASREQDPEKLVKIVEELNRVLLQREIQRKRRFSAQ
jgi:hypothetical protein